MKRAIIDRFEEDFAVCELEDESFTDIQIHLLPEGVKEGDTIVICGDCIEIDAEATKSRREAIDDLMADMWE